MEKTTLNICNLCIGYGRGRQQKIICKNLNAHIKPGELVCLLGENGTGKSTLIRTICRFQPAISGDIVICNRHLNTLTERTLATLTAVVLTDRIIVPNATVEELVGLGRSPFTGMMGRLSPADKKVVNEAIEQCGIAHKKHSLLANLSDGERQKAFIAKALAQDTPLIILDEPTAFLDLPARVEIIQLLRSIANTSNTAILMSTHDLDLAIQMADKLWLISTDGNLKSGSPEDLLLNNAFQSLFNTKGIEFDHKVGLFKVKYNHNRKITVKGDGFGAVLLRRAFARKGFKLTPEQTSNGIAIHIEDKAEPIFKVMQNKTILFSEKTIEAVVQFVLNLVEK